LLKRGIVKERCELNKEILFYFPLFQRGTGGGFENADERAIQQF